MFHYICTRNTVKTHCTNNKVQFLPWDLKHSRYQVIKLHSIKKISKHSFNFYINFGEYDWIMKWRWNTIKNGSSIFIDKITVSPERYWVLMYNINFIPIKFFATTMLCKILKKKSKCVWSTKPPSVTTFNVLFNNLYRCGSASWPLLSMTLTFQLFLHFFNWKFMKRYFHAPEKQLFL